MSTFKRVLSMAVAVAMVLSMIPAVFAAETPVIYMADAAVDLTESNTVEVPVAIAGNPGFAGMDLSISIPDGWSISRIAIKNASAYSIFYGEDEYGDMEKLATPTINLNSNGIAKFVVSADVMNFTGDGTLFWVTYNVPTETENGKYEVKVDPVKINTLEDTTVDIARDMTFTAGTITVTGGYVETNPEISMGSTVIDLNEGETTVTVPVEITDNPGFAGMDMSISIPDGWSISRIAIKNASAYSIFYGEDEYGDMEKLATPTINLNSNGIAKFVVSADVMNFTGDGTLFWVTYDVPTDTATGKYMIEVTPVKINTLEDTTVDISRDMTFTGGTVTVIGAEEEPGVDYLDMLELVGNTITINEGENSYVTVDLIANGDMEIYGIEGYWDLTEITETGYLTLKDISSDVFKFTGVNYADPSTGHILWGDDSFENPVEITKGARLMTATYKVEGDTPAGVYTVGYWSVSLTADNFEPNETEVYFCAGVTVDVIPAPGITRAELAEMVAEKFDLQYSGDVTNPFTDLGDCTDAQYDAILALFERGIVNGTSVAGIFDPDGEVMDVQAAVVIYRAMTGDTTATVDTVLDELVDAGVLEEGEVVLTSPVVVTTAVVAAWLDRVEIEGSVGSLRITISGVEESDFVTVYLYETYPGNAIAGTKIVGNGEWTFEGLTAGQSYGVMAVCEGYHDGWVSAMIYADDVTDVEIEMTKKETPDVPDLPVDPNIPTDSYLAKLQSKSAEVIVTNGEDTEVTVALIANSDMQVYGIGGQWDLTEQEGTEYLTLSGMSSEVLTFSGMNYVDVPTGKVQWTDDSFEAPGILSNGTQLLTATYAVDGDTPEGNYIVRFYAETLTADDWEPDETGVYYTAVITVKHHTHVYDQEVAAAKYLVSAATCTEAAVYYMSCECGDMTKDATFSYGKALGHVYHAESYEWAADGSACVVYAVCAHDEAHTVEIEGEITAEETLAATCTEKGETTYTADFEEEWTEDQTLTLADIPELGHDYHVVCTRCSETDPAAVLTVQTIAGDTYTYEVAYGIGSRMITVTNDIATKVGYLENGRYEAITAVFVKNNGDGTETYSFAVPSADADIGIVSDILIVVKGDISGDGEFKQGDKTLMARALLVDTKAAYKALTITEKFAADVSGDGEVKQGDKTLMARALLVESKAAYKKLGWTD